MTDHRRLANDTLAGIGRRNDLGSPDERALSGLARALLVECDRADQEQARRVKAERDLAIEKAFRQSLEQR